jgi:hypothetical protein
LAGVESPLADRALARVITGPPGFLVSGLIDAAIALRLGTIYLWRSTIRRRWATGRAS